VSRARVIGCRSGRRCCRTSSSLTVVIRISFPISGWPAWLAENLGDSVAQVEEVIAAAQGYAACAAACGSVLREVGRTGRAGGHQPQVMIKKRSQLAGEPRRKVQALQLLAHPPVPLADFAALRSQRTRLGVVLLAGANDRYCPR
jgi:hypothetical protein